MVTATQKGAKPQFYRAFSMKKGVFFSQLNTVSTILEELGLLTGRRHYPRYSGYSASYFRELSYSEIWYQCFDNQLYDFRLTDDSLIQFRINDFKPLDASYLYLECPFFKMLSYEEFAGSYEIGADEEAEYDLIRKYDLYASSPLEKKAWTPIRYDYNPKLYTEGRHPASHIHFGHKSEIRVGTQKILMPLSFLFFVIRQCYPDAWGKFTGKANAQTLCRNVRDLPQDVADDYWNEKDQWEMILV
jgi:hypothetical protein